MVDVSKVNKILERHGAKRERMIAILLDCQGNFITFPAKCWRRSLRERTSL